MYGPLVAPLKKLIQEKNLRLSFVDIGSRNGVIELFDISEFVDAHGFEPNPDEYKKLVQGTTDAASHGIYSPSYGSLKYHPYAISDRAGEGNLYITRGVGASGMLEPDPTRLKEIVWKGSSYKKNLAEDVFAVEKIVTVKTNTLDHFAQANRISHIDYLKIDVEGSEYEVLRGAQKILPHVAVIKVEVCFIPMRKGQKLFSDVDLLLRNFGFDLLRYEIMPEQVGFKVRKATWDFGPVCGFPERYGQPLQSDAIYVNRSLSNKERLCAQAAVLFDKNYLDEALFCLKRAGIAAPELVERAMTWSGGRKVRLLRAFFSFGKRLLSL